MHLRKGTQQQIVYDLLLPHQYTRTDTLAEKSGIMKPGLSTTLTKLRRSGLAECSGGVRQEGGLRWKRHPLNKPLYPPQADIVPRKNAAKQQVENYTDIADRIGADLLKLRWIIKQQQKQLVVYEEIKHKLLGDA